MNKIRIGFTAAAIITVLNSANAAPSPLQKTYDYYGNENYIAANKNSVPEKSGWYIGLSGTYGAVSWTYTADGIDSEKHSGSAFGGSLIVGKQMYGWRAEGEFGTTGTLTDKSTFNDNDGLYFSETGYYGAFNAIYDTAQKEWGGFYIGGGLGFVLVSTEFNNANNSSVQSFAPLGQILFGYEKDISDSLTASAGFRGGAYYGAQQDYGLGVKFGLGMVWNAGDIGLRYKF